MMGLRVIVLGLTLGMLASPAVAAVPQAFLTKYCADCHQGNEAEAGLDLAALGRNLADGDSFRRWVKVHDRIAAGEMPPHIAEQPADDERRDALAALRTEILAAEKARPATSRLRRLTRYEYEHTIRDLFQMPGIALSGNLPADGSAHGYDKHAEALDISHVNVAKYLEAADHVLNYAIATRPHPPSIQRRRIALVNSGGFVAHVVLNGDGVLLRDGQPNPEFPPAGEFNHLDEGAHERWGSFRRGSSVGLFRHEDESLSPYFIEHVTIYPGVYRVRTSLWSFQWDKGQVLRGRGTEAARLSVVQLTGDGRGGQHPSYVLAYFNAPADGPQEHELGVWLNHNELIGFNTASLAPVANYARKGRAMAFTGPGIVCDWLDIEGPLHATWPPASHRLLFGDLPLVEFKADERPGVRPPQRLKVRQLGAGKNRPDPEPGLWTVQSDDPAADADRLLAAFLPKLFRRPVDAAVRSRYRERVLERLAAGDSFEAAMRAAYKAALVSPDFLYHIEPPGELDDHAVACRLSYFLWNSLPDGELTSLAERGELRQPEVLELQVERMLADPRSERFIEDFLGQWLKLRAIAANDPDKKLYPEFSPYLQDAMVAETRAYFRELIDENLDASHLVKSDFAMLNEKLAVHYGITGVTGAQIRRVALPEDCPRGGFLTQGAILKITANGTTTSPVPRGAFVIDRLLGQPPEPPPANVAAIEPDVRGATTIRQQLAKHREHAVCASCHMRIDPPGFALESFDVIGGWRTRYRTIGEGDPPPRGSIDPFLPISFRLGPPVDSSGELTDGRTFADVREYQTLLAAEPERLLRNLAQQLLVYSTGREIAFGDRDDLEDVVRRTLARGGGIRTLIHEVVQSRLFVGKAMSRPIASVPPPRRERRASEADRQRVMMTSLLPELGPTESYVSPPPLPAPPADEPITVDGSHTVQVRVTGLFDRERHDEFRAAIEEFREVELVSFDPEVAEATLAYAPDAPSLRGVKPDDVIRRLNERLRQLTRGTFGLKAPGDVPRDKLERIELAVRGLDCPACSLAAYETLTRIDGVEQAQLSFREGRAVAWIDPARTNCDALVNALQKRGVGISEMASE